MPRKRKGFEENPPKQKRVLYPKENVDLALKELREGKKVCQLVRKYGIPASTIRAKSTGQHSSKPGPAAVFTADEERAIADWIFRCSEQGFRITKTHLLECVRMLCIKSQRKNPFPNNVPGRSWYENYLKRFPKVADQIAANFSASRLTLAKDKLREWFRWLPGYLSDREVGAVGPKRIFNCADIELPLQPQSAPVAAATNKKATNEEPKEKVSVLVTCDATGQLAPTLVLFAGKALPSNVTDSAPKDYAFGFSENGSVLAPNFYEYVTKVFEPWLTRNNVERPVVLYIDSHSPFLNMYLTEFCSANRIVLAPLYTNALQFIQPLDVALFVAFKSKWMELCQEFGKHSPTTGLIDKYQVAPLVRRILGSMSLNEVLQGGFKNCGLYPFNEDAVDFLKIKKKRKQNPPAERLTYDLQVSSDKEDESAPQNSSLADFEKFLTQDQILSFRANRGPVWKGATKEEGLYNIWYKLSQNTTSHVINTDQPTITIVTKDCSAPSTDVTNVYPHPDDISSICISFDDVSNIYEANNDIASVCQSTDDISSIFQSASEFTRFYQSIMASANHEDVTMPTNDKEIDTMENTIDFCIDDIMKYGFQDSNTFLVVQGS